MNDNTDERIAALQSGLAEALDAIKKLNTKVGRMGRHIAALEIDLDDVRRGCFGLSDEDSQDEW